MKLNNNLTCKLVCIGDERRKNYCQNNNNIGFQFEEDEKCCWKSEIFAGLNVVGKNVAILKESPLNEVCNTCLVGNLKYIEHRKYDITVAIDASIY